MKKNKKAKRLPYNERLDFFIMSKSNFLFALSILFSIIIFFRLFDIRVNLAGDDSTYILSGYNFLKNGTFPTWQGPLYPIFLSSIIAVFGVSVPVLKIFSSIFLLFSFFFFYKAFKDRINPTLLFSTFIIVAINSYVAYYSTFTFSESSYMFLQAIFFFFIFKFIETPNNKFSHYLLVGLLTVVIYLTRTVGLAGILALCTYLLIQLKWKKLLFSLFSFTSFYLLVHFLKKYIWGVTGGQFSSQLVTLMQKHPYQASLGKENLVGFLQRFIDNSNLYISKHFFRFIGFRSFETTAIEPILTIVFYCFVFIGLYFVFKKNKYILFSLIYLGIFLGITFFTIQKFWDQDRLIIPVFPIMLIAFFTGVYSISQKIKFLKLAPYLLYVIILGSTLNTTIKKIEGNKKILKQSLKGNMFYGFTPDWVNYMKMSEYSGKLDDSTIVACRKPGISFIYGKKSFYGISNVSTIETDSLFQSNKFYYALSVNDKLANRFKRDMISGIFHGKSINDKFMSDRYYFLFETDKIMSNILEKYLTNSNKLKNQFSPLNLFSPDILLNSLKESDVKYIIKANLRAVSKKKTSRTITTVKRYMQIISMKYPKVFLKVHEIGQDEKATLYKINYPN
ncbi:MAG: hypothetical protein L3J11_03250 [Draconibacterium sp.]|nr:hypothetical protein [Draconibacterium sp.]